MDPNVLSILRSYPQIYLACHVDHVRRRSNEYRLNSNDSNILIHLTSEGGIRAGILARHLGVRPSTLSASLKRLSELGYLQSVPTPGDRRQRLLTLTKKGEAALMASSVLDPPRIKALLNEMSAHQRKHAVEGLALLADAANAINSRRKKRHGA